MFSRCWKGPGLEARSVDISTVYSDHFVDDISTVYQAQVALRELGLAAGGEVGVTLVLAGYKQLVLGADRKPLDLTDVQRAGTGGGNEAVKFASISVTLRQPKLSYSACGWFNKSYTNLFRVQSWAKRWVVLADNKLLCFPDCEMTSAASPLESVDCADMVFASTENLDDNIAEINVSFSRSRYWQLRFLEDEPLSMRRMWLRKLNRNTNPHNQSPSK